MPPVRTRKRNYDDEELVASGAEEEDEEEDDMPPLVDQPLESPQVPTTYTFYTDMTPFSSQPGGTMLADSGPAPSVPASFDQETSTYVLPPRTTNHGKRRDASYIPRPPNAFILFRSSFIRSQRVTGKVEGNHSNLSKIIGRIWKTLPKSERDQWEDKAQLAQAEHRKKYPDWRFRPGSNALAKLKIPDPGGPSKAKRIRGTKDPPDEVVSSPVEYKFEDSAPAGKSKGKGKEKASTSRSQPKARGRSERRPEEVREQEDRAQDVDRKESEERRIAKIADFLVEGKTGVELEVAVQEWERGRKLQIKASRTTRRSGSPTNIPASVGHTTVISSAPSSTPSSAGVSPITPFYNTTHSPTTAGWAGSAPTTPYLPSSPHPGSRPTTEGDSSRASIPARRARSPSPPHPHSHDTPRRRPFIPGPSPLQIQVGGHHTSATVSRHSPLNPSAGPPPSADVEQHHPAFAISAVPLAHAPKRSSSAPAPDHRPPLPHAAASASSTSAIAGPAEHSHAARHLDAHLRQDPGQATASPLQDPTPARSSPHLAHLRPATHGHGRRDTVSLPLSHWGTPSSFNGDFHADRSHERGSPTIPRLPWQEVEDRRRHEVEFGHPIWNSSQEPEGDEGDDFEPTREGDFNMLIGGDAGAKGFPRTGDSESFTIHLPQLPPPAVDDKNVDWGTQSGAFGLSHTNLEVTYDDYGPVSPVERLAYPVETGFTYVPQGTYSPTESISPTHVNSPGLLDDTPPHLFYPQAPSRLSPHTPISTFSSLAGWDGEPARDVGAQSQVEDGPKFSPWHPPTDRVGAVQPAGLHGGNPDWVVNEGDHYSTDGTPRYSDNGLSRGH